MKLHNVSHMRSFSQSVSAFSCISFSLMTIDVSCSSKLKSCHRITLPSQLSGRYCMKKKKKTTNLLLLHTVNFTEFRPFYVRYYSVLSGGICQNCIVGIGLFRLSRSPPFFSWLRLGYLSPLNVYVKKLTSL